VELSVPDIEDVPAYRIPGHPVGKSDGIGSGEDLLGHEQLRRLAMVAADLVHPQGNSLVLVGVLALDPQYQDAVDQENHVLAGAVVAVVKGVLLGDFINIVFRISIIDQDQITLTVFLVIEKRAVIAQVANKFAVALDVRMQVTKLAR